MPIMSIIIAVVVTLIVAVPITYFATVSKLKSDADSKIGNADTKAREIIDDALKTAEAKKKGRSSSLITQRKAVLKSRYIVSRT